MDTGSCWPPDRKSPEENQLRGRLQKPRPTFLEPVYLNLFTGRRSLCSFLCLGIILQHLMASIGQNQPEEQGVAKKSPSTMKHGFPFKSQGETNHTLKLFKY
jgi:hypothetical protein